MLSEMKEKNSEQQSWPPSLKNLRRKKKQKTQNKTNPTAWVFEKSHLSIQVYIDLEGLTILPVLPPNMHTCTHARMYTLLLKFIFWKWVLSCPPAVAR